jgi:hypothetical protein
MAQRLVAAGVLTGGHVGCVLLVCLQNEKSGAFMPSQDGSRRLRDPRAMRNDYGRLPFHLAMRKGLTWLGEMLDPSVPVRWASINDAETPPAWVAP